MVLGTLERKVWKQGLGGTRSALDAALEHMAEFNKVLELHVEPGGWYPSGGG